MADQHPTPWHQPAAPDAVADSTSDVAWAVDAGRWDDLPADIADMVAPPIVVATVAPLLFPLDTAVVPAARAHPGPSGRTGRAG